MTTKVQGTNGIEFPDGSVQSSAAYSIAESNQLLNTPAFRSELLTIRNPAPGVYQPVLNQGEIFDTANCFDPTSGRFTPNVAGYYSVSANLNFQAEASLVEVICSVYKNAAEALWSSLSIPANARGSCGCDGLVYMNGTSDFIELQVYVSVAGVTIVFNTARSYFSAFLARRA